MRRATERWLGVFLFLLAWGGVQAQEPPEPGRGAAVEPLPGGPARPPPTGADPTRPPRPAPETLSAPDTAPSSSADTRPPTPEAPRVGGSLLGRAPPAPVAAPEVTSGAPVDHEPGEILAVTADLDAAEALQRRLAERGLRVRSRHLLERIGLVLTRFRLPPGADAAAALAALRRDFPDVTFDLNHLYRVQAAEPRRYGRQLVGAGADSRGCGRGVRIGLVDTRVETGHPALRGRRVTQHSLLAAGETPAPGDHGTAIAALLVGAPDTGLLAGLAPAAELFVAAVFRTRDGGMDASAMRILRGLDYLAGKDVRVVNLSLAGPDNRLLRQVATRLERQGRVLVAAVGNAGPDSPLQYPAALPEVIAVTAVDARLQVYERAARGQGIDLAAPGVDVWVARAGGGARFASGTSYAAPFVTAFAARLLSGAPLLSPAEVRNRLRAVARDLGPPGPDGIYGAGLARVPPGSCDPLSE